MEIFICKTFWLLERLELRMFSWIGHRVPICTTPTNRVRFQAETLTETGLRPDSALAASAGIPRTKILTSSWTICRHLRVQRRPWWRLKKSATTRWRRQRQQRLRPQQRGQTLAPWVREETFWRRKNLDEEKGKSWSNVNNRFVWKRRSKILAPSVRRRVFTGGNTLLRNTRRRRSTSSGPSSSRYPWPRRPSSFTTTPSTTSMLQ